MSKKKTIVVEGEANYGRSYHLIIIGDFIQFDCSDDEYGPIQLHLSILEEAIKKHKEK